MWLEDIRAVTLSSDAVLWLTRPGAAQDAAEAAFEAIRAGRSGPKELWASYEAARNGARWEDQRELPLGDYLRTAAADVPDAPALEAAIAERLAPSLEWYPDVLPTLDYLRECGYATGLVLEIPVPLPPAWAERAGAWFDAIIASRQLGVRTPASGPFAEAARRLHTVPGRVLHVGDSLAADVYGAQHAGLRAALVERPQRHAPDPAGVEWLRSRKDVAAGGVQPDLRLRSLEELAAAIDAFG